MQLTYSLAKKYCSHYSSLPKECGQSVFLTFIEASATGIYFFLTLYFVNVLHINIDTAGFLISSYGIGTILGGYISGRLSDLFSGKIVSTLSLTTQALAFFLLTKLENQISLMINMFVIGFCTYSFMTSNYLWMLKQCQDKAEIRLKSI